MPGRLTILALLLAELVSHGIPEDHFRYFPPGLVLLPQDLDEVGQPLLLLELREDEVFFELLVLVLYELPHEQGWLVEHVGRHVFLGLQPPQSLLVNQQDAVEHAMLPSRGRPRRWFPDSIPRPNGW